MSDSGHTSSLRTLFAVIAILIAATAVTLPAFGQATVSSGSIQGVVTDQTGAVVPDATVTITNTATGQAITRTTSSAGNYSSGGLQPGSYRVRVEAKGFQTVELPMVVQVGVVSAGNVKMSVGAATQVVEVTTTSTQVNTEQPSVQGVLTTQQIENLPVNGRNFLDLAQLEPGVQIQDGGNFDPTKNGFSSISFGSRAGRTARITLDGIDISDETVGTTTQNVSASAISEFQLSQSTLDLSTELTSSGAVNVVTKSGTNTIHGGGFYNFRDKTLGANFPGGKDTYFQRNQFGGNLGGPLLKNNLFFFASAERAKQDLVTPLSPEAPFTNLPSGYPAPFRDNTLFGRLDWIAPHNMRLFYHFNYNWNNDTSAYGATYQPFANRNNTPAHVTGVDWTTGNFTHSVRFGWFKFQNHIADAVAQTGIYNPGAPWDVAIRIGPAGVTTRFGPSRLAPQATFQQNTQIKYDGSWVKGAHIIRYGVDFNRIMGGGYASFYGLAPEIRTSNNAAAQTLADGGPYPGGRENPLNYFMSSAYMGNGQGYFTETPAFNYPAGGQHDYRLGMYVGDTWKITPRLALTYGVRYSRDTGRSDSDLPPATCSQITSGLNPGTLPPCTDSNPLMDAFGEGLGGKVNQPNMNFGPQLGFAWDPTGAGRTVIRGGGGLYFENAIFNNVLFDRPGRLAQGLFWGTATVCSAGNPTLQTPQGPVTTFTYGGTTYNIADACGKRVGEAAPIIGALQKYYQQQVKTAGAQSNPNFIGNTLANGNNSTGNNFFAPNYQTPQSWQMNLGFQHQIRPGMILSVDALRNVSLHYLLAFDTNHVGDARYLNPVAAQSAINATLAQYHVATIDQAIAAGATIDDFAGNGLDSGASYMYGFPASLSVNPVDGVTPLTVATGAAFPGINPLVGENDMLFPIGRATYTALQVKLTGRKEAPFQGIESISFQVGYSLSRFNTTVTDQDFVNDALDYRNPGRYYGPGGLDRTSQLSFGGTFQIKHGPQLSLIGHFFSPLAVTPLLEDQFRAGEIFHTDLTGDGTMGDVLPGANVGSFGRSLNANGLNNVISAYNSKYAGRLTPAGQALVNAGLFTEAQLIALGATADTVPAVINGQVGLGWLRVFDFKVDYPIKMTERFTLHPSAGFYNLFNFANFDSPTNFLSGVLTGTAGTINGTNKLDHYSTRVGLGTGVNTIGSPRQIEFGLRLEF